MKFFTPSGFDRMLEEEVASAAVRDSIKADLEERHQLMLKIQKRGPLHLVVLEGTLPTGVTSITKLGEQPPLGRYVVVSRVGLDDGIMQQASSAASSFENANPDDTGAVTITTYRDGRKVVESERNGRSESKGRLASEMGRTEHTSNLLSQLAKFPVEEVPGWGAARVYRSTRG